LEKLMELEIIMLSKINQFRLWNLGRKKNQGHESKRGTNKEMKGEKEKGEGEEE
jgi:hypothetical protein